MNYPLPARFALAAAMLTGLCFVGPVRAQGKPPASKPTPAPVQFVPPQIGQPLQGSRMPDVQIVAALIPVGPQMGDFSISAVYPGKVSQAEAERRAGRLLGLTGWRHSPLRFKNEALERQDVQMPSDVAPVPDAPVMSSVSFTTPDRVVNVQDGTIAVEPFLRAYRDLGRVHVTYIIPGTFPFRGLRDFTSPDIDVHLSGGGGAFTYVADIKNHNLDVLNLPLVQEAPQVAEAPAPKAPARNLGVVYAAVLALLAGTLAYLFLRR